MNKIKIVFFGSFQHYSTYILESLIKSDLIELASVVTTPPMPAGRKKELKKTHVHMFAQEHNLEVFTPENLNTQNPEALFTDKPDLFLTAGYGKLLPKAWLNYPKFKSLNLHFSLLPKYRGANPAEWAILNNESETGITLIEMSEKFDEGAILAQTKIAITDTDTRETIYEKLYKLGAEKLPTWLRQYANNSLKAILQPKISPTPRAKRLQRQDGFVAWDKINNAMNGNVEARHSVSPDAIKRKARALAGFPGLWTLIPSKSGEKRMKILTCNTACAPNSKHCQLILDKVQIEGQEIANWNQVKNIFS